MTGDKPEQQSAEDEAQSAEDEAQSAEDEAQSAEDEAQSAEDEAQSAKDEAQTEKADVPQIHPPLLYLTVLVIATSGLVYELLAGTLASYVLGDSVLQFSTTIGAYLFAMGIGSYLSKFVGEDVARRFLEVELAAAIVGGLSAPILFLGFAYADFFSVLLYGVVGIIGVLVGLEVPLLMRLLKEQLKFEELVAKVLTFDYVGALVGSLLFAIVLVPQLGLNRTSLLFGMLNAAVALGGTRVLAPLLSRGERIKLGGTAVLVLIGLAIAFTQSARLTDYTEQALYNDPIVFARQTPYQRVIVTQSTTGTQLFLNGNLQFASSDEYRYHEALVHPAFAAAAGEARVLVLGGGDGLALREIWKHEGVESVTLVDLDQAVTEMARSLPSIRALHGGAFDDPRLTLVHDDAMVWLDEHSDEHSEAPFDVVIVDFPDPNNFSLGKLYTSRFYNLVANAMSPRGALVVQSTSPLYARRSFWCIERTIAETGFHTRAYHATVPSFGEWGYVLAMQQPFDVPSEIDVPVRYLDGATMQSLFAFPPDMDRVDVDPNRLDDQRLVRYYDEEWSRLQ